jgi:ribosomal-protein-alanine N-acetyltransferase
VSVKIEPFSPADAEECALIERLSFSAATLDLPAETARSMARVWVARPTVGGPPLGFLLAWVVIDELEILSVATHPEARRQGAAKALCEQALAEARAAGCRRMLLEVRRGNDPAIALYRRLGFHVAGVRRRYYPDNDEDALLMNLDLDAEGRVVPGVDDLS